MDFTHVDQRSSASYDQLTPGTPRNGPDVLGVKVIMRRTTTAGASEGNTAHREPIGKR